MQSFFQKESHKEIETFSSKYKPYHIKDFRINTKLISILNSFLKLDDLNLLICGPISSGKTSLLYAMIRDYYLLKKGDTLPENNILMINNLKEQGINYYRSEMKTFCQSRCSIYGKKKLIIVDDMDMISDQCQQVFRNYIDKYKNNVHFISVCTTLEKVIESIQSRLHIIHLQMPEKKEVIEFTNKIINNEKMNITEDAKIYMCEFCNYQIREILNYLERLYIIYSSHTTIELNDCKKSVSCISFHEFDLYINFLKQKKIKEAIHLLYNIYDYGYSVIDIFDFFFQFIKTTSNLNENEKYLMLPLLCEYITNFHNIHENIIEIVLFTRDLQELL